MTRLFGLIKLICFSPKWNQSNLVKALSRMLAVFFCSECLSFDFVAVIYKVKIYLVFSLYILKNFQVWKPPNFLPNLQTFHIFFFKSPNFINQGLTGLLKLKTHLVLTLSLLDQAAQTETSCTDRNTFLFWFNQNNTKIIMRCFSE